jgi:4-alpha-glucanotransferase
VLHYGLTIDSLVQVMQELGLVGLRIQRMPNESDLEFGIPSQYSYMTVNFPYTIAYPYFTLVCL